MTLQPVSRQGERRAVALSGSGDVLSFSFDNVLPGKYKGQDSLPATLYIPNSSSNSYYDVYSFIPCNISFGVDWSYYK